MQFVKRERVYMSNETTPRRGILAAGLRRLFALALVLAIVGAIVGVSAVAPQGQALLSTALTHTASVASADDPTAAIQAVIQKANDEQQQAFAANDPTLMKDTSTSSYYNEMVRTNRNLVDNGVKAIKLVKLEWGDVTVTSDTAATATTYETWQTTYTDGTTDVSRDQNVYTLVLDNGAWKIQGDDHPDASAGQAPTAPTSPSAPQPPSRRINPNSDNVSHNWSGYAATGGTYTSVTGTWTVPQSDGTTRFGTVAAWVGIGGVSSRDLVQAGTMQTSSGNGSVQYQAWIETLPQPSHRVAFAIKPGDSVTVSITEQQDDQWLIDFKNNTTGATYQTTVNYTSSHSSAEWVAEAPVAGRRIAPLDNFGTITFSEGSAVKDGATVNIADAGARAITMIDVYNNTLATPSAVTPDGSGFSVTRNATTPTQTTPGVGGFPSQGVPGSGRSRGNGNGQPPRRYPLGADAFPFSAGLLIVGH